jgi:hypothetical protein
MQGTTQRACSEQADRVQQAEPVGVLILFYLSLASSALMQPAFAGRMASVLQLLLESGVDVCNRSYVAYCHCLP